MEQTIYDRNAARVLTDNPADYHVPVNLDVPQIDVLFVNEPHLSVVRVFETEGGFNGGRGSSDV